mgnify:CR=1 FL=1
MEECFIRYLNTAKWIETTRRSRGFFNQLRSVWISGETLFQVFDIASQGIDSSWGNTKQTLEILPLCVHSQVLSRKLLVSNAWLVFILPRFHRFVPVSLRDCGIRHSQRACNLVETSL